MEGFELGSPWWQPSILTTIPTQRVTIIDFKINIWTSSMKNFENLGAQKMVLKHLNKQIFFSAYITNKYHFIFDNSQPFPDLVLCQNWMHVFKQSWRLLWYFLVLIGSALLSTCYLSLVWRVFRNSGPQNVGQGRLTKPLFHKSLVNLCFEPSKMLFKQPLCQNQSTQLTSKFKVYSKTGNRVIRLRVETF